MDPMDAYLIYAGIILLGPTFGAGVGGLIVHKAGGYRKPKALMICSFFYFIGAGCGIMLPFI